MWKRRVVRREKGRVSRHAVFVVDDIYHTVEGQRLVSVRFGLRGCEEEWETLSLAIGNSVEVDLSASIELLSLRD